jgi:hypothetical protein
MRRNGLLWSVFAIVVCLLGAASHNNARQASNPGQYAGTWAGTWDGSGSGEFEMTLDKRKDGGLTGRVAVMTDGGNYTADLKAVSFDGNRLTAKYDYPLDTSSEVAVAGTFEGRAAKGTWSLRTKGQDAEVVGGSWIVTKK